MELRHLRYFVAVAEELSFTRGAARLHMAQPALSSQIRQLESELAVELFDRSRRAISLTPAGETMLVETQRLLMSLEQSIDLVRRIDAGAVGTIRVGFVPSALNSDLPVALSRFGEAYPDVAVILQELRPDDLLAGLRAARLDICFMYLPIVDASLDHLVILRERFVAAVPASHALASKQTLTAADLRTEPFITTARHGMPGLNAKVVEICSEAGFVPRTIVEKVWLLQTIVSLVAAGHGVAIVPASSQVYGTEGVAFRPLKSVAKHEVELAAVWRHEDPSPSLAGLRRHLEALVAP